MAELKTKKTAASPEKFLSAIKDEQKREDSFVLLEMMKKATKAQPKMWGASMIGFGNRKVTYANGKQADWYVIGFSPRKEALTLFQVLGGKVPPAKLGKFKTSKYCLFIKKLEDVDMAVLKKMIETAAKK